MFTFGKNWKRYLKTVTEREIQFSMDDIQSWIPAEEIKNKTILDIGSGSGLHSLSFNRLGAKSVVSFDYDKDSVEATREMKARWCNNAENWIIQQGSVLDQGYLNSLGKFDIVYSWGVLHHTGKMWDAIRSAASTVKSGGLFFISLYSKGPKYQDILALKQKYNRSWVIGKRWMELKYILRFMHIRAKSHKNPFGWNTTDGRGMHVYTDITDWLGGLPYEESSVDEVKEFGGDLDFDLVKVKEVLEGGNNIYLFRRK